MSALIVCDTKYGMTEKMATAIMKGMKEGGVSEVAMKKVGDAYEAITRRQIAWTFESPVRIEGATGDAKKALKTAIDTGANGKKGTAFDTRFANATGKGAAEKMMERMEKAGIKKTTEPEWFVVLKTKEPDR